MSSALALALLAPLALGTDPVATVPMKEWNGLVLVPVSVQGSSPFQLVLDTAMSLPGVILFKGERLDALGLDFQGDAQVSGAGGEGRAAIRHAKASSIELGGITFADVVVSTFPDAPPLPGNLAGIIGSEHFQRFAVRVDRAHGVVELHESAKLEPSTGSTQIPLQVKDGFPCVQVMVAVADEAPIAAELIVDLGAMHALWLNTDSEGRFAPPSKSIATVGYGVGGRVEGRVGRSRFVQIGDVRLEYVVTVFPAPAQNRPGDPRVRDGFIGADVLSRFDLTIDYPGQRLIVGPARIDAPFEWDMSGLELNPSGGGVVDSVEEGSAAEEAGILVGDVLVSVDDTPIAELLGGGLRQAFRREGAELRLKLKRGDETLEKRLRLKRLI